MQTEKEIEPTFADVKTAYLFKLVEMHDAIAWHLAKGDVTSAKALISVLLARIDVTDASEFIKTAKKDFLNGQSYSDKYPNTKVVYAEISDFLNKTYFAECKGGKPKYTTKGVLGAPQQ
jgi:hypothetical protein